MQKKSDVTISPNSINFRLIRIRLIDNTLHDSKPYRSNLRYFYLMDKKYLDLSVI